jgi:hypothetical protein
MEFTDNSEIKLDTGKKQKVKCYTYKCKQLGRDLIIHENVDNKNHTSVSDKITGYRLFGLNIKPDKVKLTDLDEPLDRFIRHFTLEEIHKEFERIENLHETVNETTDEGTVTESTN